MWTLRYQSLDWSNGNTAAKAFKFIAYSFNGVTPIEPNPDFLDQMAQVGEVIVLGVRTR